MTTTGQGLGNVAPGTTVSVEMDGQPVAVANVDGTLYAFDDYCTHRQCLLSEGTLAGTVVSCGCHGSQFDVTTGAVLRGPAKMPLSTFKVEIVDGELRLDIIERAAEAVEQPASPAIAAAAPAAASPTPAVEAEVALTHVPLFSGLPAVSLQTLQALCFRRTFRPDEVIVEEGRTGNGCYVVVSGRVEVVRGLPDRPQVLATFGPGEPFGEMALLGDWKRTASVVAIEETTCIGIDRWVFLAFLRREPELAVRMLQLVAQRLVDTNQRLSASA